MTTSSNVANTHQQHQEVVVVEEEALDDVASIAFPSRINEVESNSSSNDNNMQAQSAVSSSTTADTFAPPSLIETTATATATAEAKALIASNEEGSDDETVMVTTINDNNNLNSVGEDCINTDQNEKIMSTITINHQPNYYTTQLKQKQRRIHSIKVGLGILLALQFVLIEPLDTFFQHTGAWAVITTGVVILKTPGETTKKMINRTIGTIIAAIFAILCGIIGYKLSNTTTMIPLGHIFIALINFVVAIVGTYYSDSGGTWSYAFLLGMITFVFLSSSIFVEDNNIWVGVFRAIMIAIGGCIGLLVSWLPMGGSSATNLAKSHLADALLDTSIAGEILVGNFIEGKILTPIHEIYDDEKRDDEFHKYSKSVQISRVPFEAALQASLFEGTSKSTIESMRLSGLAIRLTLRSLLAADLLLRQEYVKLNATIKEEVQLGLALKGVVTSIQDMMVSHQMIDLNVTVREGVGNDGDTDDDEERSPRMSFNSLSQALIVLNSCLKDYLRKYESSSSGLNGSDNNDMIMQRFACHVGFARNIYDAGTHFQNVLPHLIVTAKEVESVHFVSSDNI